MINKWKKRQQKKKQTKQSGHKLTKVQKNIPQKIKASINLGSNEDNAVCLKVQIRFKRKQFKAPNKEFNQSEIIKVRQ